ncbi:MAG: S-adenosylmethionine:tRNA ribosyltransferase-isomerase, partial [Nitrospinaceae bacterium]|nr:S-adenosylmethionine:tRNA ribosyltransferase-isomerase [Nitrospinaceae bacterium]NIR53845.1 S-adenosylmethionine:tRNA ribosyltransferase-isomerase [Nitrospinaceae bacterium]NIS84256.1 S-adenosylmethionine:tRNA ribosyltransferase-isomerase [Nitrospinaceae bacterium]NIT81060.1 S-adenosylmethionine:tRNA ribosyltransferase-isomerase [Nitrospinaceae bacterium]NIU43351.1 S-adenosylmethionine:tRNA ribosyltransferase-isomerase [Nitrospinaceae bacterium]
QTVYAGREGAIAAPTAGLHFTPPMLENIRSLGSQIVFLTLHVGPGTFTPIRRENVAQHRMEAEWYRIPQTTWNLIGDEKKKGKNVLAVGTTTTRVLESLDFSDPVEGDVEGWTDRFLYPGQPIRTVDHLLTNFHLPRSTLFLLVCAFADRDLIRQAYREAIQNKYRFFSYGDAMLIL